MNTAILNISQISKHPTMRMDAKYWTKEKDKTRQIKVRFNLGRGKNYMKWKVESTSGVEYHSPDDVQIVMNNCILKNNKKKAEKILNGESKSVCAWIKCEKISIIPKEKWTLYTLNDNVHRLRYNPRVQPHWECRSKELTGKYDLDNETFDTIVSQKKELFILPENN